eukprot:68259_1
MAAIKKISSNDENTIDYVKQLSIPRLLQVWIYKKSRYLGRLRKRHAVYCLDKRILYTKQNENGNNTETIHLDDYKRESSRKCKEQQKELNQGNNWHNLFVLEPNNPSNHATFCFFDHFMNKNTYNYEWSESTGRYVCMELKKTIAASYKFIEIRNALQNKNWDVAKRALYNIPFDICCHFSCNPRQYVYGMYSFQDCEKYFKLSLHLPWDKNDKKDVNIRVATLNNYLIAMRTYQRWLLKRDKIKLLNLMKEACELSEYKNVISLAYFGYFLIDLDLDIDEGINYIRKSFELTLHCSHFEETGIYREYWISDGLYKQKKIFECEGVLNDAIKTHNLKSRSTWKYTQEIFTLLRKVEKEKLIQIQNKFSNANDSGIDSSSTIKILQKRHTTLGQ